MLAGFTNGGLQGGLCPLLSMGKLGWVNWEIILLVVFHHGSLLPVIPLFLGLGNQLRESVLSLKSRVSLEGHGITLLSVKILMWYQSLFWFRDPIFFHHHGVWFTSIIMHNVINSSSILNGDTRSNAVEGYGSLVLIQSEEVFLKWCGHVWGTGIKIKFYWCHWSRAFHHGFSCIRVRSYSRNLCHACRGMM